MSEGNLQSIVVRNNGNSYFREEREAAAAITPGTVLLLNSSDQYVVNTITALGVPRRFAVEDDLQGNEISDVYASGSRVQANVFQAGCEVLGIAVDGTPAIVIGDPIATGAAGELVKAATFATAIAIAKEAIDVSGGSVALVDRRFVIEVI